MKFSIIIPVYNCEKGLHLSVNSIIRQTYTDWELILVNDGSKDHSLHVCNWFASRDSRIIVIDQENSGSGAARNNGITHATGDYIVFCDADDFYDKNGLSALANEIERTSPDLVIGSYNEFRFVSDKKIKIRRKTIKSLYLDNQKSVRDNYVELYKQSLITAPWCKAYKRSTVVDNCVRFPDLRRCQDIIFNLNFYEHVESLSVIDKSVYNYQTPDSETYLKKLPIDMYDINKKVYAIIEQKLKSWNEWKGSSYEYYNSRFIVDAALVLRLNYRNSWNKNVDERKKLYYYIINDNYLSLSLQTKAYGLKASIIKPILKSKNVALINLFNLMSIVYIEIQNWGITK